MGAASPALETIAASKNNTIQERMEEMRKQGNPKGKSVITSKNTNKGNTTSDYGILRVRLCTATTVQYRGQASRPDLASVAISGLFPNHCVAVPGLFSSH